MKRGEVWWVDMPARCVVNLDDITTLPKILI